MVIRTIVVVAAIAAGMVVALLAFSRSAQHGLPTVACTGAGDCLSTTDPALPGG